MASQVDETVPADNVKVEKSDVRSNFTVIKNEITTLQSQSSLAWQIARSIISI